MGSGTFTESKTDQTVYNANGRKTETVSLSTGATPNSSTSVTTRVDGPTKTSLQDNTGVGYATSQSTDVTVLNAVTARPPRL